LSLDPYGYPEARPAPSPRQEHGVLWRWGFTLAWLMMDVVVLVCSGLFTAFAWDTPDDPQYIVLFSVPWWGFAGVGTVVSGIAGAARLHPALQFVLAAAFGMAAWVVFPTLWFGGLVATEIVR
jgi:hypothetical protein